MSVARRTRAAALVGGLVFCVSWIFRFNTPEGSFAGLTDDHFFYLIRGWQILLGDLPVRDFADQGAPAYYYVAAAVQTVFGRGTLSEFTYSVTVLSAAATLTYWLGLRASGSVLYGLLGAAFQIVLEPRAYNYPKLAVYAVAVPLLWRFIDRPTAWPRFWLAVITAAAFLLRHDHGAFVALAFAALLLIHRELSLFDRCRHAIVYAALVTALLGPYLLFIQMNGGVGEYFEEASAWAARDRERAPVVWPGLFEYPDGRSTVPDNATPARAVAAIQDNAVAFLYYVEIALPLFAAVVLAFARDACRRSWPHASIKMAVVIVLGVALDAGFLRSPLKARLADPSVPLSILIAWLCVAVPALRREESWRPAWLRWRRPIGGVVSVAALGLAFVLTLATTAGLPDHLDSAGMTLADLPRRPFETAGRMATRLRTEWDLSTWKDRTDRPDLMTLSMYLDACTSPEARVFVQPYIPQVLGLARRGFAGGHPDMRPGFFNSPTAQLRTVARLWRQHVPVAIMESGLEYQHFRQSFPIVTAYLDEQYQLVGTHGFDGNRFAIQLFARKDAFSTTRFALLDWPCYG